jgi:cell division protein FtsA
MVKQKNNIVTALDVGGSKTCCFIAESTDAGTLEILGVGYCSAGGIKSGRIVDMEAAEHAIASAIQMAEEEAGIRVNSAYISLCGGTPLSETHTITLPVGGAEITGSDLRKLLSQAKHHNQHHRTIFHKIPLGYQLDNTPDIEDPRGMYGEQLSSLVHIITAESAILRTLGLCMKRCHITVKAFVAAPYASALACLTEDEMQRGSILLDLGSHTTSLALFYGGRLQHVAILPIGGYHVTNDLAHGLSTNTHDAERLKTLHGSASTRAVTDREMVDVPVMGELDQVVMHSVPKGQLARIIQPRAEEIFEMARAHLQSIGMEAITEQSVVLTGGGSLLPAIRDIAVTVLANKVRLAKPQDFLGNLPLDYQSAVFSTTAGLLRYSQLPHAWTPANDPYAHPQGGGWWRGTLNWIKENF